MEGLDSKYPTSEAWVTFLRRFHWDWFATFTFRETIHPEAADKKFRVWVSQINRQLFGVRWYKRKSGGVAWVRGLEWQRRGVIHYHALMTHPLNLNNKLSRLEAMRRWERLGGGFARIEAVESQQDTCAYVSKYVVKGGEIDLSVNLPYYQTED